MEFLRAFAKEFSLEILELPFEMLAEQTLLGEGFAFRCVGATLFLQIGLKSANLFLKVRGCRGSGDGLLLA